MKNLIHTPINWLHLRFDGRSWDIPLHELNIGQLANDTYVHTAVANYLHIPVTKLMQYTIERHGDGNITIRPEAIFG